VTTPSPPVPASVIIVSWNGRRWIDRCLRSVAALDPPAAEVVLVDNGSTDDTVAHVRRAYPRVTIVALAENTGFAAGNNAGARAAASPYLVFLNNDVEVDPSWLGELAAPAARDASVGLVTSRIVYMDRPGVIDSAGDGYLRCGGAFKRLHGQPAQAGDTPGDVFGACGAACLIRRGLFESLGGFDEDFFMVYEDVDLSYRARLTGARCVYAPRAIVRHEGSGSIGHVSAQQVFYGQRNLEWAWIKNTPPRLLWRSLPSHIAYDIAAAVAYARRGHLGPWLRGKRAAAARWGRMLRKRREIQRAAVADPESLWALMERDWIGVKRREKSFDFAEPTSARSPRSPGT
jgi:GT2 family glycosyltransferase